MAAHAQAPTSDGVNVCTPANGANVTSPVQISAAATVSGGVFRFELWNGSTKLAVRRRQRDHGPDYLAGAGDLQADL